MKKIMFFAAAAAMTAVSCNGLEGNSNVKDPVIGEIDVIEPWDLENIELDYGNQSKTLNFEWLSEDSGTSYSILFSLDEEFSGVERVECDGTSISLTHLELDNLLSSLGVGEYRQGEVFWGVEGVNGNSSSRSEVRSMRLLRFYKPFSDPRDGEMYRVMRSADAMTGEYAVWLADNMRATEYSDGTILTDEDVKFYAPVDGEDDGITAVLGGYYSWTAAVRGEKGSEYGEKIQGICPSGWHVPTRQEWEYLINNTPDNTQPGEALKDKNYWDAGAENKNTLGFNIVGAGYIWEPVKDNPVIEKGSSTYFWTSTVPQEGDSIPWDPDPALFPAQALTFAFNKNDHGAALYPYNRQRGFNVRCVLD